MTPSATELTLPASAAGACAWAAAASAAVIAPVVRASRKLRDGIGRLLDLRSPHRRRVACHELASHASLNPGIHGFKTDHGRKRLLLEHDFSENRYPPRIKSGACSGRSSSRCSAAAR